MPRLNILLCFVQVQLMELLITHLGRGKRYSEQRKLLVSKLRLKKRMEPQLARLQGWLGGGYVGFNSLPAELRLHVEAPPGAWSVNDICRGQYPWEQRAAAAAAEPSPQSATREQLVTQLRSHSSEVGRWQEELALLFKENQQCLTFYAGNGCHRQCH